MLLWRLLLLRALFRVPVIIIMGGSSEAATRPTMFPFLMLHDSWMTLPYRHLITCLVMVIMVILVTALDNNLRFTLLHPKWSSRTTSRR